ncbi:hypothetical protein [Nocardiopsis terrae]|uniref:hypothetical protein n=1 Tax=Nocardiopsis terrae TaxID=372655 RepID=UPI001CEF2200|nr:hypothetical protein [Nocardiopsis terrae]
MTGSWALAIAWGLVLAGLLGSGLSANPFTVTCTAAVTSLFALRGAAFGAPRLVGPAPGESADTAAGATRILARVALGSVAVTVVAAAGFGGPVLVRPEVAVVLVAVLVAALTATSGLSGPMLSRPTSALAIAVPGLLVASSAQLPSADIPQVTAVFVWSMLAPAVPVMFLGQVWLYRMTRRPATSPSVFA